jgi:hypothetical protein
MGIEGLCLNLSLKMSGEVPIFGHDTVVMQASVSSTKMPFSGPEAHSEICASDPI